jgi:sulfate-transporting ATPase
VLIYRGAGVVNLGHGAYAMLAAWMTWDFEKRGIPTALAIILAILAMAFAGFLTDQLLLRKLRTASPLARLISTLGVLSLLQAITTFEWGVVPQVASSVLPSTPIKLGSVQFPSDRIWLLLIAVVLTAVLSLVWSRTRAGWVAEAVSENQRLSASLGWSPELVSALTWTVGAGLAGLAGVFIAPITQLDATTMPLLVVPALAAALMAGFRSFWLTLAAAIGIGIAQSEISRYTHITGLADGVPFLIIIVILAIRGSALPLRGHAFDRLPRIGTGWVRWQIVVPFVVIALVLINVLNSPDWQTAFTSTFGTAIVLLSFVVLVGYTGQISLAQYTLAGLGALVAAQLSATAHWPFWAALLIGAVSAAGIGILFSLPALRTRGINLAIVTLGLALATNSIVFASSTFAGPYQGLSLGTPSLFGLSLDPVSHPVRYTLFAFVVFVILALAVARLRRTAAGRTLLSVRDNERGAASNGVNVFTAKVLGFAIAGLLAGVGGIIQVFQQPLATFSAGYDPLTSINYLAYSVIGGIGFIGGTVFGGQFNPNSVGSIIALHIQSFDRYLPLVSAVALLITLLFNPHGWAFQVARTGSRWFKTRDAGVAAETEPEVVPVPPVGLTVRDLVVRYGPTVAIDHVGLEVSPGQIVGLIGPNGAGKTSFMDAVTGFTVNRGGTILLGSTDVTGWPAYRLANRGLVRSFQNLELYPDLTVRENVLVAADHHNLRSLARSFGASGSQDLTPMMTAMLQELRLEHCLDRLPEELSNGQRRLLAVARAIAPSPSVLLVDEPVAGLDDRESAEFSNVLRSLAARWRMSVLLVEHDMNVVMAVSDRIVVIDFGRKVAEGTPDEIRNDPVAISAYLGTDMPEESPAGNSPACAPDPEQPQQVTRR